MNTQLVIAPYVLFVLTSYFLGKQIIGSRWALLPAFFTAFIGRPEIFASGFNSVKSTLILASIFSLLMLFKKTTLFQIIVTGLLLGSALSLYHDAAFLAILYPIILALFLTSSIASSWKETDPAVRAMRARTKIIRHTETFLKVLAITFVIIYLYGLVMPTVKSTNAPVWINWLNDNTALKPAGQYLLNLTDYFAAKSNQIIIPSKSAVPAIVFIILGLALGLARTIKSFFKSFARGSSVLLDYLAINFQDFALIFILIFYAILSPVFPAALGTFYNLLPLMLILAGGAIKKWFYAAKTEGFVLRVSVFENNILGFSLKSLAILCLIFWQILVGISL